MGVGTIDRERLATRLGEGRWLELLLAQTPAIFFAIDADGVVQIAEGRGLERIGFSTTDVLGKTTRELFPDQPAVHAALARALGGETFTGLLEVGGVPLQVSWGPVRDGDRVLGTTGLAVDVSERVMAERALADQAEMLRAIVDAAPMAVNAVDTQGRHRLWSRGAERIFGWTAAEVLGGPSPAVPPEGREEYAAIQRELAAGRAVQKEVVRVRRDGSRLLASVSAAPIHTRDGNVVGGVAVIDDVTERREAERVLARLGAIVADSQDAIISIDTEGRVTSWNPGAERLLGYTAAEALGRSNTLYVPPDARDITDAVLARVHRGERVERIESERVHKDGRRIPVELTLSPLRAGDEIVGSSGILRDISERRRTEEERRVHAARLETLAVASRALAEAQPDLRATFDAIASTLAERLGDACAVRMATLDRDWLRSVAHAHRDPAVSAILGEIFREMDRTDFGPTGEAFETGRAVLVSDFDPASLPDATRARYAEYLARAGISSMAVVPICDHAHTIGTVTLLRDRGSPPLTHDDLTLVRELADRAGLAIEQANSFEAEKEARRKARRAQRRASRLARELERRVEARTAQLEVMLEEVEALGYSISHDLRQPLRAIDGFAHLIAEEEGARLSPEGRGWLERVRAAGRRMASLIDDLQSLSKVARPRVHPEELDLSALAGEIAGKLARAHPERAVDVVIEPDLQVTGDPVLLRVVVEHLLENAWKFTAPHPTARIEVGAGPAELHRKTFYVRDDGVGFDPALADQLFQPLRRLHGGEFTGSGIGLATVQRILRRHGGRAWATAEPDEGATFWFTIGRPVVA